MPYPLSKSVFDNWKRFAAQAATDEGVHVPMMCDLPAGMEAVVLFNRRDTTTTRDPLKCVNEIVSCGAANYSLGIKDFSLLDWTVGFVGTSRTRQIKFANGVDSDWQFTVADRLRNPSYGSQSGNYIEIAIAVASDCTPQTALEEIDGRLEFNNLISYNRATYSVQVKFR